jgi:cyclic pyranopterin phosphate synthase
MNQLLRLVDGYGRRITYLRISVTERCDLRCAYCRSAQEAPQSEGDLLSPDDIANIAQAALSLGIRRFRLTGGEPLLRDDLEQIVARINALPGVTDLALTTNGQRLASRARLLAAAGLRRVNASLDSLDRATYATITGGGDLDQVLRGIEAALEAGLAPVKINVVLASAAAPALGELEAFAALVRERPLHVRFIEAMPTCGHTSYLPAERLLERLGAEHELAPAAGPEGGGPARYYRLDGSRGTIGVIAAISAPFCGECNRLRVTAQGELMPCLFSPAGLSLTPALRGADPVGEVRARLAEAAAAKPSRYCEVAEPTGIRAMRVVGG